MLRRSVIAAGLGALALASSAQAWDVSHARARNAKLDALLARSMPEIKDYWKGLRDAGIDSAPTAATDAVDAAIVAYFGRLKALADPATDAQILTEMKRLYHTLNTLNAKSEDELLATDERELLVPIFVEAAEICGIDSKKYDGEPGGQYRDF